MEPAGKPAQSEALQPRGEPDGNASARLPENGAAGGAGDPDMFW
jgi:hypothetical protein